MAALWSSGQSSWLQIQRSRFYSRRYQIFWKVVGVERDPLSLLSTIEELLERKSRDSGLESREYVRRNSSLWPRGNLYPQKLALSSSTRCGRLVCIVHSRTQATESVFVCFAPKCCIVFPLSLASDLQCNFRYVSFSLAVCYYELFAT
jgi:hypothetical protein